MIAITIQVIAVMAAALLGYALGLRAGLRFRQTQINELAGQVENIRQLELARLRATSGDLPDGVKRRISERLATLAVEASGGDDDTAKSR